MVLADGAGTRPGVYLKQASPAEVTLLAPTLQQVRVMVSRGKHGKAPAADQ